MSGETRSRALDNVPKNASSVYENLLNEASVSKNRRRRECPPVTSLRRPILSVESQSASRHNRSSSISILVRRTSGFHRQSVRRIVVEFTSSIDIHPSVSFHFHLANRSKYSSNASSTYVPYGKNVSITYGDGSSAQGVFSIDRVTVSNTAFVQVDSACGFQKHFLLGIGACLMRSFLSNASPLTPSRQRIQLRERDH